MLASDLAYWPRQYVAGFVRLWQFNGPWTALRLTLCNLFGVRRLFRIRLYGFEVSVRSATPDLAVAIDSLGAEFEPVAGLADPAGLIIDAGGYIGTAALKFSTMFPGSKIISIEPSAENLELLRRNVEGRPNITVMQAALAASEGQVMLRDTGSGEWGFSILANAAGKHKGRALGAVPTVTVESILAHERRQRLSLLKLDVEGAEVDILNNSRGWIDRTDVIIAELHEAIAPGAERAFAAATQGRDNRRLPGEKVMSRRGR